MMFYDFQTTTHGKWILSGEHAVVRGHEAIVFPVKEKYFTLGYKKSRALGAEYSGISGAEMHLLFWSVLEQGMQLLGLSLNQLVGTFYLESTIPVGVGMGASAALCVAMARWFCYQDMIKTHQLKDFAKELEHLFHGKSSGLDIAGVAAEQGVFFKQGSSTPIKQVYFPKWYLSSCNQIGITAHCIAQVQQLWDKDPVEALKLDKQMNAATLEAKNILEQGGDQALEALVSALKQAAHCFVQWGLVSENLQQHMNQLRVEGALAVKPTGSGGGGFVISLWDSEPPSNNIDFIAV